MQQTHLHFLQKQLQTFLFALIFSLPILSGALFLSLGYERLYIALNTLFALCALIAFIKIDKKMRFYFGFYIGVLLFYWIALSFRFSPIPILIPLIIFLVASIYGLIFTFLLWFENIFFRILALLFLGYIHPFYFDWLFVESFFAYSIFGVDKISFCCVLLGVFFLLQKGKIRIFALLFLTLATLQTEFFKTYKAPLDIELAQTAVPQDIRWDSENLYQIVQKNLQYIQDAIKNRKAMVVLPETAFPIVLNHYPQILASLKELSQNIAIVTGALRGDGDRIFNSTYIFNEGNIEMIDKVVLAPFGEKIPLPNFLAKPLSKLFFGTEQSFDFAKEPRNFVIDNKIFRNAICYEGTSKILYQDKPQYVVVISNNAWFYPSIEPFFQQILLKYYARISKALILHSANFSDSMIITPSLFLGK